MTVDQGAKILSHVPNSGIVHLPGRKYPAVAIQGDTLYRFFRVARELLSEAKRLRHEEMYYNALDIAEDLQRQLLHYEETLEKHGYNLPYLKSIRDDLVKDEWESS
jgi:hypothetical protein